MIDHQIDRHEWLNDFRITTESFHRTPHCCEVDHQWHAGEILQDDAGDDEWNFLVRRRFGVPVRQRFDIFASDFLAIAIAQHGLEHDPDAHWQSRYFPNSLFLKRRKRIKKAIAAFPGIKFSQRFKFVVHA